MPRRTRFDRPAPLPHHDNLTVREVANFMRVSRTTVYDLVHEGTVPSIPMGRQIRIPRVRFLTWYESFFGQKDSA